MNNPDPKFFPNAGDESCTHTIGLYKSGRCRSCGFKVMESLRKRINKLLRRDYGRLRSL